MAKALIFTDAHNNSLLTVKGPYSETHGSSKYPNQAVAKLSSLVDIANANGYSHMHSNGDITSIHGDMDLALKGAFEMVAALQQFNGSTSLGIGNHEPFWALGQLGINPETFKVGMRGFRHTEFIVAQPQVTAKQRGLEYSLNSAETAELIRNSTATNLVLLQHWSALRQAPKGFKDRSPYFYVPNTQPVIDALEERKKQGGEVFQFSGDAHEYLERQSEAGVRYAISPSFSQSHKDNPSQPCNIIVELEEDNIGNLSYRFKQLATLHGTNEPTLVEIKQEELLLYTKGGEGSDSYQRKYIPMPAITHQRVA